MFRWKGLLFILGLVTALAVIVYLADHPSFKKQIFFDFRKPTTIAEEYDDDMEKVDKLTISDGRTGKIKTFTDNKTIHALLDSISNIKFKPDNNYKENKGWIYSVALYEGNDKKMNFLPNEINGGHYIFNQKAYKCIDELYHSK